jgi:hypothetical protein
MTEVEQRNDSTRGIAELFGLLLTTGEGTSEDAALILSMIVELAEYDKELLTWAPGNL